MFIPAFDPVVTMAAMQEHRVTDVLLVPTMMQMIVDHPRCGEFDLSSLAHITYGASPISEALLERVRKAFPAAELVQAYGMTELSPVATILLDEDHADPVLRRSAGRAAPHAVVKIVDPDGNEVPRGTVGEIVVRGDHVMLGYWNKPEETAAAVRDGWMHTGDGGYMDENGYVFIADRIKDMIISGGENVYSIEVENAVANHPAVAQVRSDRRPRRAVGRARARRRRPRSRRHARPSTSCGRTARPRSLTYKVPRSMEIVEALPGVGRRQDPQAGSAQAVRAGRRDRLSTTVGFHGPGRSLVVESVGTASIPSGWPPRSDVGHAHLDVVRRIT